MVPTSQLPLRIISETYKLSYLNLSKKKTRLISILEKSSKCMYFDFLAPINFCFVQDNLDRSCGDSEAVIGAMAFKDAPVESLRKIEMVCCLPKFIVLPDLVRMMGRMLL